MVQMMSMQMSAIESALPLLEFPSVTVLGQCLVLQLV
jgi:hypothetical protein